MEALAHHRFATLVEPHLPSLRAYVERRSPELTDDVMQELGVVAWRRLAEMPPGHERAWLCFDPAKYDVEEPLELAAGR